MCGQGWVVQHLCSPVVTKAVFCLCRLMIISKLVVWHYYCSIKYSFICTYENALWMRCTRLGLKRCDWYHYLPLVFLWSRPWAPHCQYGPNLLTAVFLRSVSCCRVVPLCQLMFYRTGPSLQEAVPPSPPDLRRLSDPPLEFVVLCPRDLDLCPFPVHDVVLPLAVIRDWF